MRHLNEPVLTDCAGSAAQVGQVGLSEVCDPVPAFGDAPSRSSHERTACRSPAATIVGRDRLTEAIVEIVLSDRVVTLTGVGGVGETRLAVEAAGRLTDRFSDGVRMIELAPVGDPDAVPDAIANALGIAPQGDGAVIDAVADAVAGRRMLLVLDSCEHVARATGSAIQRTLERSPTPHILATSRESL